MVRFFFIVAGLALALSTNLAGQIAGGVNSVEFDKKSAMLACPWSRSPNAYCSKSDRTEVRVKSTAIGVGTSKVTYYYIPTGGRIVGEGDEVIWDLTDVAPGEYNLTVGVGTGDILYGTTITKSLVVKECDICDPPCSCPTFEIIPPRSDIKAGDTFLVRLNVGGGDKLRYKWVLSRGAIVGSNDGQGLIVRSSAKDAEKQIRITLAIDGTDAACNCPTTDSITVPIHKR